MMNNPTTGYQPLVDDDYKMQVYVSSLKGLLRVRGCLSCWKATPEPPVR